MAAPYGFRKSSGSLATFAAIRSWLSNLAPDRNCSTFSHLSEVPLVRHSPNGGSTHA
jgi:hypothetical protein